MDLPKVLIIGQSFNNDTGGGITLTNLFKGWDRNKIAVACSGYLLVGNIDTEVCNNYYQLGHKEHKFKFPFHLLQRKYTSGILKFDNNRVQKIVVPKSKFRISLIVNVFFPFLEYIGVFQMINRVKLSNDFCNWLDEYKPDVIYDQTASRAGVLFCLSVQSYLNKPLIFHMMDDWPSTLNDNGLRAKYWKKKIDREFRTLLDKASILLSISDEMAAEYKIRYNKNFVTFHNAIDLKFWKNHQRNHYELSANATILYAGRTGLGIDTSLELFAKAITSVNEELNMSMKFILQTPERPYWLKKYKNIEHKRFVPYENLPKVFAESDLLLLPYDFSVNAIKFIKLSMPTKAPEYMISGTPILIFAPEITAVAKYANKFNWAKTITNNNLSEIKTAILQIITNKELRKYYAENAIKTAEKNHNSSFITYKFRSIICSIANSIE